MHSRGERKSMTFGYQTRGTMAQVLAASSEDAARTFVYKHSGVIASKMPPLRVVMANAQQESIQSMILELLVKNEVLRAASPVPHVFDSAVAELGRWALHDGWMVDGDALVRVMPMTEEVTGVRDKLAEDLATSGIDGDAAIRGAIENSSKCFTAQPPDFNGSITQARLALETVARRAATRVAMTRSASYPQDSWGKALEFLRSHAVIEPGEEKILVNVYTFISQGAHVPQGVTAEEWARLARTFAISSTYFLHRKWIAA